MTQTVARTVVLLLGTALVSLLVGSPVRADDVTICGRPEVLSFAAEKMQKSDAHLTLIADTAAEAGAPNSNVVLCVVTVQVRVYDLGAYRVHPATILEPRYFEVRQLGDGFEINFTGS